MPRSIDSGEGTHLVGRIRNDLQYHTANVRSATSDFEQWRGQWNETRSKLDNLLASLTARLQNC